MDKELDISPEVAERALRGFLMDQECENPGFIRRLLDDLEDDAACLKLAMKTDAESNEKISEEEFFKLLRE